jgi:hypothetical protein
MEAPEGCAFIKVGKDQVALVDADLVGELGKHKWHLGTGGYAFGYIDKRLIAMHRVVNATPKGMETDHINHVRLDNRRCNLRTCTRLQNCYNNSAHGKIKYRGVHKPSNGTGTYRAAIKFKGKPFVIGDFPTPEMAARAYDNAAKSLHGEFANLNFKD